MALDACLTSLTLFTYKGMALRTTPLKLGLGDLTAIHANNENAMEQAHQTKMYALTVKLSRESLQCKSTKGKQSCRQVTLKVQKVGSHDKQELCDNCVREKITKIL